MEECRVAARSSVHRTLSENLRDGDKLVVGVSGGGDSNALLYALSTFTEFRLDVHPVILKGLPEWDSGVARANELCETYGYRLTVIEEQEIREILGLSSRPTSLAAHFYHHYPEEDFEFFGVYLIGAALVHAASAIGAKYVCKGANLEDLLGDSLYMLMNGISLNRPGFRGGCLVKVKQPHRRMCRVGCSSLPQPRPAGYSRWMSAGAYG